MANLNNSLSLNEQRATTKKVWEPKSMVNFPSMGLTDANKNIRIINVNRKKNCKESLDTFSNKVEILKDLFQIVKEIFKWLFKMQ